MENNNRNYKSVYKNKIRLIIKHQRKFYKLNFISH